ncbi:MAG: hypothetical protein ACLF0G_01030 [Candidatus Brocadiia bacterium]
MVEDGTDDCFDGGLALLVNGQQFYSQRPTMTADGSELVLSKTIQGIEVTRRIWVDRERSAARYLEIFHNPTEEEAELSVAIQSVLGDEAQQAFTSEGGPLGNELGRKACGIVAVGKHNRPAVVFVVAGARGRCQPSVQNRGHTFAFIYKIEVEPQATVAIAHVVAQRRGVTTANVEETFKPFHRHGRLLKARVPESLQPAVVNFRVGVGLAAQAGPAAVLEAMNLALDHLGVERGESDLLVIDLDARLAGEASCEALSVKTDYGNAEMGLEDVALLLGGKDVGRRMRVYRRDGEVLTGRVEARGLKLVTAAGFEIQLVPEQLNALVLHADADDGKPHPDAVGFIATHRGDRLALDAPEGLCVDAITPWGALQVPLASLDTLKSDVYPVPGYRLVLRDQSRVSVLLRGGAQQVRTLRFGDVELATHEVASLVRVRPRSKVKQSEGDDPDDYPDAFDYGGTHFVLAGENYVVGTFAQPALRIITSAGVTALDTTMIRLLERAEEGEATALPRFDIQLTEGGVLSGRLEDRVVPIRWGSATLRVPVYHIVSFVAAEEAKEAGETGKPTRERQEGPAPANAGAAPEASHAGF